MARHLEHLMRAGARCKRAVIYLLSDHDGKSAFSESLARSISRDQAPRIKPVVNGRSHAQSMLNV